MEKISAKYMLKYIDYFRKDNRKLYAIEEKNGIYYPAYDKTFIQFEEDFRNLTYIISFTIDYKKLTLQHKL